jgi:hypothetical protein
VPTKKKAATSKTKTTKKSAATGSRGKSSRKTKNSSATKATKRASATHDPEVPVDRRAKSDRRQSADRRTEDVAVPVNRRKLERREKVSRRRQIDPTTCERDYTVEEIEFMAAMDQYKRTSGRMFPTCSEVLEVLYDLGYRKVDAPTNAAWPASEAAAPEVKAATFKSSADSLD